MLQLLVLLIRICCFDKDMLHCLDRIQSHRLELNDHPYIGFLWGQVREVRFLDGTSAFD